MLFSSSIFLFAFLPAVLLGYYVVFRGMRRAQNLLLLAASLLFYAWGEPWFVLVMIASILANYLFGLWVHTWKRWGRRLLLPVTTACVCNLGLLFVFKYLTFTLENLGRLGLNVTIPVIELLREETSLASFMAGFKLAWGLSKELEVDGLYSFDEEETERVCRQIGKEE